MRRRYQVKLLYSSRSKCRCTVATRAQKLCSKVAFQGKASISLICNASVQALLSPVEHCIAIDGLLVAHAMTMHTHSPSPLKMHAETECVCIVTACILRGNKDQQGHRRHCYCFLKQSHGCSSHKRMSQSSCSASICPLTPAIIMLH